MVGADYSQTRCVGGDGGPRSTRARFRQDSGVRRNFCPGAGVRVGRLGAGTAERGLELPLTPEMGQIPWAVAVTTLPQASYEVGSGAVSSCVTEMKLITPQGKQMV